MIRRNRRKRGGKCRKISGCAAGPDFLTKTDDWSTDDLLIFESVPDLIYQPFGIDSAEEKS